MSEFGWALTMGFVVAIAAVGMFIRRTGQRLTPMLALLPIPAAFLLAGLLLTTWRALTLGVKFTQ